MHLQQIEESAYMKKSIKLTTEEIQLQKEIAALNWIELENGKVTNSHGAWSTKLQNSPDFKYYQFIYSVWEVVIGCYVVKADCQKPVAIHLTCESTLARALEFMRENRILVFNKDALAREREHIRISQIYLFNRDIRKVKP